jgi:hypothetical protein
MRKLVILVLGIVFCWHAVNAQSGLVKTWTEDFDGTVSFTASPPSSWVFDPTYHLPGSSVSNPRSYLGLVPNATGAQTILQTPIYDMTGMNYVILSFSQICKVSTNDKVRIEYREAGFTNWTAIPNADYLGKATNYGVNGFNAFSYPEWLANDSTAFPQQSWWKDETFDLSIDVNNGLFEFRFIIEHGLIPGTQASYGWLLENFELVAAPFEVKPPVVEFVSPLVQNIAFNTGPWEINARVKTMTNAPTVQPWLKYTATLNGSIVANDSVLMAPVGTTNELWKGTIPKFLLGTEVAYSITGYDTNGNNATVTGFYLITDLLTGTLTYDYVYFGRYNELTGTTSQTNVLSTSQTKSWSRHLYLNAELAGVDPLKYTIINSIAFYTPFMSLGTTRSLRIYMKAVTQTTQAQTYLNPVADGATLVYTGPFAPVMQSYPNLAFTEFPFVLPAGQNLMVYVEDDAATAAGILDWRLENDSIGDAKMTVYGASHLTGSFTAGAAKPVTRFGTVERVKFAYNSVALDSILTTETIPTSPGTPVPVVVTIGNEGAIDLTTAVIGWSLNGVPQTPVYNWSGTLPWGFKSTVTIGSYQPKVNGRDTITAWVKLPNGVIDTATADDTLTRIVYGSTDIVMAFVDTPEDTVNTTGPFTITASIRSLSGTPIPSVNLDVVATHNAVTTPYTLPMSFNAVTNLWEATIPKTILGSDVSYSITMTDQLGNVGRIEKSYNIQISYCPGGPVNGMFTIQEDMFSAPNYYPAYYNYGYVRTMVLYTAAEINSSVVGPITKIGFRLDVTDAGNTPIKIWLKTVPASKTTWTTGADNQDWAVLTADATLVYDNRFSFTTGAWCDIPLSTPFEYTHTDNLVVMFEQNCGGSGCGNTFASYLAFYNASVSARVWQKRSNTNPPTTATALNIVNYRPDLRVEINNICADSNSVELVSIDAPSAGGQTSGTPVPIQVSIRNAGIHNLTSCTIGWSVNGIIQGSYSYVGNVPWDFTDVVTIGTYTPPTLNQADTLVVWVSDPNGVSDATTTDDTLRVYTLGCMGNLSGILNIGPGGDYTNLNDVLLDIRRCGMTGDLSLRLKGTYAQTLDLRNYVNYTNGYTLTITSWGNHPDSAIITSTGVGIRLGNVNNIVVKAITVNTPTAHAIQFEAGCSHIVIRDCKLLTSPTTVNNICPIFKDQGTEFADNIAIIHNELDGGYAGIYYYGGTGYTAGGYGPLLVIDSNIIRNSYGMGIYLLYTEATISYNTVTPRPTYIPDTYYGIYLRYVNGSVIGNRILALNTAILQIDGINVGYYNYYLANNIRGLIANNEIRITATTNTTWGLSAIKVLGMTNADIVHNSVYITGGTISPKMGVYIGDVMWINDFNHLSIRNNNFVIPDTIAYPIVFIGYIMVNQYDIDYNNYNTLLYAGYYNNLGRTLPIWRQMIANDLHSVQIAPNFVDISVDMDLMIDQTTLVGLSCPFNPLVPDDILWVPRTAQTTMGAYHPILYPLNIALLGITPWDAEVLNLQTYPVTVSVFNAGSTALSTVNFAWTLNGILQTPFVWTPTTPLAYNTQQYVTIDSFRVASDTAYDVVVWVTGLNAGQDMNNRNDTARAGALKKDLAEFVAPFMRDTTSYLSFDIHARILGASGAPLTPPHLTIETRINGIFFYDTLPMVQYGNVWTASVPQQYYGSTVIYSLFIEDLLGNTRNLIDSVHIRYGDKVDSVIIGTGTVSNYSTPINMFYPYSWSRQIYLYREVCPNLSPTGAYITKIAWQSQSATAVYTNQTCYMKAINDSLAGVLYASPLLNGYTQVWKGTLTILPGWVEIELQTPFLLPANMNLEILWEHRHGAYTNNTHTWAHTSTPMSLTAHARAMGAFPANEVAFREDYRPNIKITKSQPSDPYQGYNLTILSLVNPVNVSISECVNDYSPLQVVVFNWGSQDYDFAQDSITLGYDVIDAIGVHHSGLFPVTTGVLESGKTLTLELTPNLPTMYAGEYAITVWVNSPIDIVSFDDTLHYTFRSNRVGLPIASNFSQGAFPFGLASTPVVGINTWEPYTPNLSEPVQPNYGTGFLRFTGTAGSMSVLGSYQLELYGTFQPKMEFWYYHDASLPAIDNTYTDVNVIVDGIRYTVMTLSKRGAVTGWEHYMVNLNSFAGYAAQCLLIQFESMNKYAGSYQYIDSLLITSEPDLEVVAVLLPNFSVCNLLNQSISVAIRAGTSNAIDLSTTDLELDIKGAKQRVALQGTLAGKAYDTISFPNLVDLDTGIYTIKAYLTTPVDGYPANDTARYTIDTHPSLSIRAKEYTTQATPVDAATPMNQLITIRNTGNMELSNIRLRLKVLVNAQPDTTIEETLTATIAAGDSLTYMFNSVYFVPWTSIYGVFIEAMGCDSAKIYANTNISEYVNTDDLELRSIDHPTGAGIDTVGNQVYVKITLRNNSLVNFFTNIKATVELRGSNDALIGFPFAEPIPDIPLLSGDTSFTFAQAYTVPNDSVYTLTVFITDLYGNPLDNFHHNDTVWVKRKTDASIGITNIDGTSISMSQNIPNPATGTTRIDYSLPTDGEVIFHVYTISGQELFNQAVETISGRHSIELNTASLASGIYFYSMEFKGQRIVKRMSVNN